jgi:hypothetical protein
MQKRRRAIRLSGCLAWFDSSILAPLQGAPQQNETPRVNPGLCFHAPSASGRRSHLVSCYVVIMIVARPGRRREYSNPKERLRCLAWFDSEVPLEGPPQQNKTHSGPNPIRVVLSMFQRKRRDISIFFNFLTSVNRWRSALPLGGTLSSKATSINYRS